VHVAVLVVPPVRAVVDEKLLTTVDETSGKVLEISVGERLVPEVGRHAAVVHHAVAQHHHPLLLAAAVEHVVAQLAANLLLVDLERRADLHHLLGLEVGCCENPAAPDRGDAERDVPPFVLRPVAHHILCGTVISWLPASHSTTTADGGKRKKIRRPFFFSFLWTRIGK